MSGSSQLSGRLRPFSRGQEGSGLFLKLGPRYGTVPRVFSHVKKEGEKGYGAGCHPCALHQGWVRPVPPSSSEPEVLLLGAEPAPAVLMQLYKRAQPGGGPVQPHLQPPPARPHLCSAPPPSHGWDNVTPLSSSRALHQARVSAVTNFPVTPSLGGWGVGGGSGVPTAGGGGLRGAPFHGGGEQTRVADARSRCARRDASAGSGTKLRVGAGKAARSDRLLLVSRSNTGCSRRGAARAVRCGTGAARRGRDGAESGG